MKKLLGIAALVVAMSPLAYAQSHMNNGLSGHPDARNDRTYDSKPVVMKHKHKAVKHHRHHKRHHAHAHAGK